MASGEKKDWRWETTHSLEAAVKWILKKAGAQVVLIVRAEDVAFGLKRNARQRRRPGRREMGLIEIPPPGTNCRVCACCKAGKYVQDGGVRYPICMACDEDVPCAGELARTVDVVVKPEAKASEPKRVDEVIEMAEFLCEGGCGEASTKPGYKWGHKNGCPKPGTNKALGGGKAKSQELARIEPEIVVDELQEEYVALTVSRGMLDRIWQALPLAEQALGLETALLADREGNGE